MGVAAVVISFLGHRSLHNRNDLFGGVKKAILENGDFSNGIIFFCGGYGNFDDLCAQACRSIKESRQNCEIIFVTPYITVAQQEKIKRWMELELYDSVLYPPLEQVPLKFAIGKRNEWIIDQSDLIIAYVEHSFGGAYQGLNYAQRKRKRIVNLACEKNLSKK